MAVYDTTMTGTNSYTLVSQNSKNFDRDTNFYLRTMQDKIDSDWNMRSNRVDLEIEDEKGAEKYSPLEVVIQTVKDEKGKVISDDVRKVVFRDIMFKPPIGTRFRFSYNFDLDEPDEDKNIWISLNKNTSSPTAENVITRCNGTLGTIWTGEDGKGKPIYHYEPCIATHDLGGVGIDWNNTIPSVRADQYIIVQHNKYTKLYEKNQRFIVGLNEVFKVKYISRNDSLHTYDADDVSYTILYCDHDEENPLDEFEKRIAYFKAERLPDAPPVKVGSFFIKIVEPVSIPTELFSTPISFRYGIFDGDTEVGLPIPVRIDITLEGVDPVTAKNYFVFSGSDDTFTLRRTKVYSRAPLKVSISVQTDNGFIPVDEELNVTFEISLRGLE